MRVLITFVTAVALFFCGASALADNGAACWREGVLDDPQAAQEIAGPGFAYGLTVTPSEAFSSSRTRIWPFTCAIQPDSPIEVAVAPDYPGPYNAVTRGPDELFLLAGQTNGDQPLDGAYLVKFNTSGLGLEEEWRVQLINTTETDEWNYPGVVGIDASGRVFMVYGYRLSEVDGDTGEILQTVELPVIGAAPSDTSFNGFNLLSDGTIVTKCISRVPGCTAQGFAAFLDCPQPTQNSTLLLLDGQTLELLQELELPAAMGGRITSGIYRDREYIYLSGTGGSVYRWLYDPAEKKVELDESWQGMAKTGRLSGPTSALAMVGDWVVTMTNAVQSMVPMIMSAINQEDASKVLSITPFENSLKELNGTLLENLENGTIVSWAASAIAADPENMLVYPFDFVVGKLAAYELSDLGFKLRWEVDQRTANFLQLLGGPLDRVIVGTHVPELSGLPQPPSLTSYSMELMQFRDAATGELLAESGSLGPAQAIPSTPGFGGQYFYYSMLDTPSVFKLSYQVRNEEVGLDGTETDLITGSGNGNSSTIGEGGVGEDGDDVAAPAATPSPTAPIPTNGAARRGLPAGLGAAVAAVAAGAAAALLLPALS